MIYAIFSIYSDTNYVKFSKIMSKFCTKRCKLYVFYHELSGNESILLQVETGINKMADNVSCAHANWTKS